MSIGIDFGIGIDQNSWYRTGIVSKPKKLVSPITSAYMMFPGGREPSPYRRPPRAFLSPIETSCKIHIREWWDLIGNFCSVVLTFDLIDCQVIKKNSII